MKAFESDLAGFNSSRLRILMVIHQVSVGYEYGLKDHT